MNDNDIRYLHKLISCELKCNYKKKKEEKVINQAVIDKIESRINDLKTVMHGDVHRVYDEIIHNLLIRLAYGMITNEQAIHYLSEIECIRKHRNIQEGYRIKRKMEDWYSEQ